MSEHRSYELPHEISKDDLIYLRLRPEEPGEFENMAKELGWDVHVDENRYDAHYVLARPIAMDFDDGEVASLQEKIGIVDDWGDLLSGYALWGERVGSEIEHDPDFPFIFIAQTDRLLFDFKGYPTEETMAVLEKLICTFPPEEKQGLWMRGLAYFGLAKRAKKKL
jgi:hypothetical protein